MVAIIDYGVGNLFSLGSSFAAIGEEAVVTEDPSIIAQADRIILPGVGAFADAMHKLHTTGLDDVLKAEVQKGKPVMGICLGMQMLFEKSYECVKYISKREKYELISNWILMCDKQIYKLKKLELEKEINDLYNLSTLSIISLYSFMSLPLRFKFNSVLIFSISNFNFFLIFFTGNFSCSIFSIIF